MDGGLPSLGKTINPGSLGAGRGPEINRAKSSLSSRVRINPVQLINRANQAVYQASRQFLRFLDYFINNDYLALYYNDVRHVKNKALAYTKRRKGQKSAIGT